MSSSQNNRKRLGADGEHIVAVHLERLGWRILVTNFRCRAGEIDLIAEEPTPDGETLVFIEVKTRRGQAHGAPAESVTLQKQQKLVTVAQYYLGSRESGDPEPRCRFDIAEVLLTPSGTASVKLLRGAFGA